MSRLRIGTVVADEVRDRDDVRGGGLSDATVLWLLGRPVGSRAAAPIVFGAVAEAVRRESNRAGCHFWGVTREEVVHDLRAAGTVHGPGTVAKALADLTAPAGW